MFDSVLSVAPSDVTETTSNGILPCQARGLVFEAGGKRLIDHIDLDLKGNAITIIMGPNGAGKSVLLRLLHGLIAPSAGEVRWGGRPIDEAIRKRQAMVFQRPVLLRRSVAANIRFVLRLRKQSAADSRARLHQILEQAGLADLAGRPARVLSGGEQHRLAVARALALEPEVLFLDEPTASLEPASVAAVEALARNAKRSGIKVILVTHDVGQARRLADEVVFVHRGRVAEHAPAERFFEGPAAQAARDYLAGRIVL